MITLGINFLNKFGKTEEEMIAETISNFGINDLTDKEDIINRSIEAGMNLARRNDYFEMVDKYGRQEVLNSQLESAKTSGKIEGIACVAGFLILTIVGQKIAAKIAKAFDEKMEERWEEKT